MYPCAERHPCGEDMVCMPSGGNSLPTLTPSHEGMQAAIPLLGCTQGPGHTEESFHFSHEEKKKGQVSGRLFLSQMGCTSRLCHLNSS